MYTVDNVVVKAYVHRIYTVRNKWYNIDYKMV